MTRVGLAAVIRICQITIKPIYITLQPAATMVSTHCHAHCLGYSNLQPSLHKTLPGQTVFTHRSVTSLIMVKLYFLLKRKKRWLWRIKTTIKGKKSNSWWWSLTKEATPPSLLPAQSAPTTITQTHRLINYRVKNNTGAFRDLQKLSTETVTSPQSTAFPTLVKPTSPEYTMVDGVDWKNSLLLKSNTPTAPQKAAVKSLPAPEGYLTPDLLDNITH